MQLKKIHVYVKYLSDCQVSYGNLVYKFKRIAGKPSFPDQLKITKCYKRFRYSIDLMPALLVINPVMVLAMVSSLIAQWWVGS